ncbi:outer membrane beta-barrel protein, partial [Klebsiella pneumoniae]|uniref:outer membrane beta-barrel protein n=1 Tax=Klebsiella pneumoniae TaxID=573 RepID=UPI00301365C0
NGWGFNAAADLSFHLPLKMEIFSDANYEFRSKTQSFNSDFKRLLWNARISKNFLKSDNLKLSFFVNDLLNQNKGFDRSAYGNMI